MCNLRKLQFSGGVKSSMTSFVCCIQLHPLSTQTQHTSLHCCRGIANSRQLAGALHSPHYLCDLTGWPCLSTAHQNSLAEQVQSTKRCCTSVHAEACTNAICHLRWAHLELVGSGPAAAESLQRRQEVAGRVQGDALRALQLRRHRPAHDGDVDWLETVRPLMGGHDIRAATRMQLSTHSRNPKP